MKALKISPVLITIMLCLTINTSYSCTCDPYAFCETVMIHDNSIVVTGIRIEGDSSRMKLKIIESLKGNYNSDTVEIWETYDALIDSFFCYYSIQSGVDIGDTMVVAIKPIDSLTLTIWGDSTDYIFINHICYISVLWFKNDSVRGSINHVYPWAEMTYSQFRNDFNTIMDNCATGISDLSKPSIKLFPNPTTETLIVDIGANYTSETFVTIFDLKGRVVQKLNFNESKTSLDLSHLNKGVYFVEICNNNLLDRRKIIVN